MGCFFRYQILSGFAHVFGDMADGRIEVALLEHWRNTLHGLEPWRQPIYYVPTPGTLGYNDGYLLFGLVYAAWRAAGADSFLAADLVNVIVHVVGFAGFLAFAQRVCGLGFGWAVLGASVFTLSNPAFVEVDHAQLLTLAFAPWLGVLLWQAAENLRLHRAWRAAAWGCAAAALYDSWLLTAFYMAWFTALFATLMAVAGLALAASRRATFAAAWRTAPWWPVAAVVVVLASGTIPMVMTYLPVVRAVGMHPPAGIPDAAPTPFGLINTGAGNLAYGGLNGLLQRILWPDVPLDGEAASGMPLLLLGFSLVGAAAAWFGRPAPRRMLWQTLAAAFLLSLALPLQVGHATLWRYVYDAVPAAGAIRVVSRYLLFLSLPATLLAMDGLRRCSRSWPPALLGLAGVLMLAEQVNLTPQDHIPRAEERHFLASIPPPPGCGAFAVTAPRVLPLTLITPDLQHLIPDIDAMLVAETIHVPTLNGVASLVPVGFRLGDAGGSDSAVAARRAAVAAGLADTVCGLDLVAMAWQPAPLPAPPLAVGRRVQLPRAAPDSGAYLAAGWSGGEATGRWTEAPEAILDFATPKTSHDLLLALEGAPFSAGAAPSRIAVSANGRPLTVWDPIPGPQTLRARIPAAWIGPHGNVTLRLVFASPRRPSDVDPPPGEARSLDSRQLGLWAEAFTVTEAP